MWKKRPTSAWRALPDLQLMCPSLLVHRIGGIKLAGERSGEQIVLAALERPLGVHPAQDVIDKGLVEVGGSYLSDLLLHKSRSKGVGATDFQNVLAPGEHFGNEFIPGEREYEVAGIVDPDLVGHQAESGEALFLCNLKGALILRLSGAQPLLILGLRFGCHKASGVSATF